MAGVYADSEPRVLLDAVDDPCQLLEAVADIRALTGGGLEQDQRAIERNLVEDRVQGVRHAGEHGILVRIRVAHRVHDESGEAQPLTGTDLLRERRSGAGEDRAVAGSEAREVDVVREADANGGRVPRLAELQDVGIRELPSPPLPRAGREDLDRGAAQSLPPRESGVKAARRRHVRAEKEHPGILGTCTRAAPAATLRA